MRRVLFVHNGPLGRGTDGRVYGVHYTNNIKKRYLQLGDHVTFLMREEAVDAQAENLSLIDERNFEFVPAPNLMSPLDRVLNHRATVGVVDSAIRNTDILVARIPSLLSRLAIRQAKKYRIPYIVECVGCNWDALWNYGLLGKLSAGWYAARQRSVVTMSPYVVYVTESFLQKRYPTTGKQVAISNVQLEETDPSVLEARLEQICSRARSRKPFRLVTVADVSVPYKGHADVIRSLKELNKAGLACEYHLIGGGDQSRLMALGQSEGVDQQMIFHGSQKHADVFQLLDEMDVYVQPSRQEGLPRAVIEAMSRALTVVGARTGGIPELIPGERVYTAGEFLALASTLQRALTKESMEQDAVRNFRRASNFTAQTLSERRRKFYSDFLVDYGFIN